MDGHRQDRQDHQNTASAPPESFADLQQARMTVNVMLCVVAMFLAFTQMPNLLIMIVITFITGAVMLGRGGLMMFTIPMAITVNGLIGTGFVRGDTAVQIPDLINTGLMLTYLAMASARLELGRTSWKSITLFSEPEPIEQRDRYRLRPLRGMVAIVLVATLFGFIVLQLTPFGNVSPGLTGLIRPSTRMLLLIWAMASCYLVLQLVFRRLRWRQQGQLEARMHVLQTLGDYVSNEQDAIVRRQIRLVKKAADSRLNR